MRRRGHRDIECRFEVGLVEAREHPLCVSGFELRVEVHLVVDRVDEPVQTFAGVRVAAVRVDDQDVVGGQAGQCDAGGFVITRDVDGRAVERRAVDGLGGEVDVGVGAGERLELHSGGRAEGLLARLSGTVGQIQGDAIAVHGDESGALGCLVAGQIGKGHARQH